MRYLEEIENPSNVEKSWKPIQFIRKAEKLKFDLFEDEFQIYLICKTKKNVLLTLASWKTSKLFGSPTPKKEFEKMLKNLNKATISWDYLLFSQLLPTNVEYRIIYYARLGRAFCTNSALHSAASSRDFWVWVSALLFPALIYDICYSKILRYLILHCFSVNVSIRGENGELSEFFTCSLRLFCNTVCRPTKSKILWNVSSPIRELLGLLL